MSTLPLHVCQVLEDEYVALHGAPASAPRSWDFQDGDFVDSTRFIRRLGELTDPLSIFLKGKLAPAATLGQALNAVIREPLYTEARFRHVHLDWDLAPLVSLAIDDPEDLKHLNRRLLESAYPNEIHPIYELRLDTLYKAVHARAKPDEAGHATEPQTALCLSGGGIRSATFALGVIQGLARLGLLDKLDYLSTVSGGGYVGSWLSGWAHRHREGMPGVARELRADPPRPPLEPEPKTLRHLRQYTNYLSPRLGLMSADTWTLVATYVRNLFLTWLVLVPLLIAAAMVPRIATALLHWGPSDSIRVLCLVAGMVLLIACVAHMGLYRPSLEEFRKRRSLGEPGQGQFLRFCFAPLLFASMFLVAYWTWQTYSLTVPELDWARDLLTTLGVPVPPDWAWFVVVGVLLHLVAWGIYSTRLRRADLDEFVVVISTGGAGGWLVWAASAYILPFPRISNTTTILLYVCFGVPLFLAIFLLAATLFVGLTSRRTDDEDREWWARFGAWVLMASLGWAVVGTLVIFAPHWLRDQATHVKALIASFGGVSGVIAALAGRSAKTSAKDAPAVKGVGAFLGRHSLTLATVLGIAALVVGLSLGANGLLVLAKIVLTPWASGLVADLPDRLTQQMEVLQTTRVDLSVIVTVLMVAIAWLLGSSINVNKFSLHAMYRNRLVRAYLGASREHRRPNPFTGFDPDDNIQMHELRGEAFDEGSFTDLAGFVQRLKDGRDAPATALVGMLTNTKKTISAYRGSPQRSFRENLFDELNRLLAGPKVVTCPDLGGNSAGAALQGVARVHRGRALLEAKFPEIAKSPTRKPLHVVNMALNLVAGHNLAWQERKAESFTVTPWHAGSYHLGYRPSLEYGGSRPGRLGISLGTAVAISGAAASPNMGYQSSPLLAFLMTLFNVRLGWWLGNPGPSGGKTYKKPFPMPSVRPIVEEALALTDDTNPWVYLSDGGHFDNLGLLEMVLRRCHLIVLSDAGCDPTCAFDDLGNAIRKVRSDLGVPITVDQELRLYSRDDAEGRKRGSYAALATIDYRAVDGPGSAQGRLIYVKPCVYWSTEPIDVQNYARTSETFPHETTADQFFGESQFESYRALGLHEIQHLWTITWPGQWPATAVTLAVFVEHVGQYLGLSHPAPPGPTT